MKTIDEKINLFWDFMEMVSLKQEELEPIWPYLKNILYINGDFNPNKLFDEDIDLDASFETEIVSYCIDRSLRKGTIKRTFPDAWIEEYQIMEATKENFNLSDLPEALSDVMDFYLESLWLDNDIDVIKMFKILEKENV